MEPSSALPSSGHSAALVWLVLRTDGDQVGAGIGGGVLKGAEWGLCCHGDLAALSSVQAHPRAWGSWVLVGLNQPPPDLFLSPI